MNKQQINKMAKILAWVEIDTKVSPATVWKLLRAETKARWRVQAEMVLEQWEAPEEKFKHPVDIVWLHQSCMATCSCPLMGIGNSVVEAMDRLHAKHKDPDQYKLVAARKWQD